MRSPTARRTACVIGCGVGAVTCLVAGQSWIYEHVERSTARALCGDRCVIDADPTSTLLAFPLAVLTGIIATVLLGAMLRRTTPPGPALRIGLLAAVIVAVSASAVVLKRTNWLRGADDISVCYGYRGEPGRPIDPWDCSPRRDPATALWLLAAAAFTVIGALATSGGPPTARK